MKCLFLICGISILCTSLMAKVESISSKEFVVSRMENGWSVQNAAKEYSLMLTDEVTRHPGEKSYRFELRDDDTWKMDNSFRSEISTDDYVSANTVQWYGLSFYIPKDFPKEDNRLVIGQWWAKNKKWLGEGSRTPVLCQHYRNGRFEIVLRFSPDRIVAADSDPNRTVLYKKPNFDIGKWHDVIYEVKWSYKNDGFINAWMDGEQIIRYKGPVGYNDDIGPTFKFGLYRDDSKSTQVIYFDRIKRGNSFSEVDPKIPQTKR